MGKLRAGVFFATYGHWSLALQQAEYEIAWHCQPDIKSDNLDILDKTASKVLQMNFLDIPIRPTSKVDIICGSPPCIGFTQANPNSGVEHWANKNFIRCFKRIGELQPKYFLVEMVPRILKIGEIIYQEALSYVKGYHIQYKIFEVSEYGVPARRERLYIFGSRSDNIPSLLESLPKEKLVGCCVVLDKYPYDIKPDNKNLKSLMTKGGKLREGPFKLLLQKSRVLKPEGPSFTITGTAITNMKHYARDRLLTIQEIADLMGFPSNYKWGTDSIGKKCQMVASGIDIRFTTKLLTYIRGRLSNETI